MTNEPGHEGSPASPSGRTAAPTPTTGRSSHEVAAAAVTDDDLRVFLDMSTDLLGVFDADRGLLWSNQVATSVLGYAPHELDGAQLGTLLHPEDVPGAAGVLDAFLPGTELSGVETRYRTKDGSWRWLEWSAVRDLEDGLVYGAARDVTDRHAGQVAMRRNERLLQAIVDHSAAAIFVKDAQERYVLVNDAFLRPMGLRRDQVIGKTRSDIWGELVPPGDDVDRRILSTGQSVTRDDEMELADGPHTLMTVRFPLRDDSGHVVGVAGIASDITERTAEEHELSGRERLLDTIVRASPDIVTMLDRHGRVEEVSQASARILGYDLEHPIHEELEALVHPDDLPAVYREYGKLLTLDRHQIELRYRVRHRDGHWVTLDTRGQAIEIRPGETAGAVVVSRDVTADLVFEQELQAAVEAAEQASTAKSEFLSRMSHELRTPLNSVLGFAQLLEMEELDEQQQEAVGHIMRAGHHLLNLIDEVLDIARIESGRLELSVEPVPVRTVIADAIDMTRLLAQDRAITLTVDFDRCPTDAHVRADRQRLMQVLLNLLSNGVKYNTSGGEVAVTVEDVGEEVTSIAVRDTGPGIDPSDMDRVFRPFDRLGAEQSGVEGTGVGLTLSKYLVEEMGGSIELHTAVGRGTTFTVTLPTIEPPSRRRSDSGAVRHGGTLGGQLRILHIEDNLANLELVEQLLRRTGIVELYAAMYGSLGLELAREHRPDLILLDLHLPDMTGAQVLERLRDDPETESVPVVVVSADATPTQIRRLRGSGVLAYLTKPIDVHELLRIVDMIGAEVAGRREEEET